MKYLTLDKDGVREEDIGPDDAAYEAEVAARVAEEVSGIEVSAARARLARLQAGYNEIARPVKAGGDTWFIRRLDMEGITRVGLMSARGRDGALQVTQEGVLRGLLAAMLFCCVVNGKFDRTPFFTTFAEAYDQAVSTAPAVVAVNEVLFAQILEVNPEILPDPKKSSTETADDAVPLSVGTDGRSSWPLI